MHEDAAITLSEIGRWLAAKNWVPATGGNFSIRLDSQSCLISASGKDKGALSIEDCLHIQWQGHEIHCQGKPSDETLLHTCIYDHDVTAGAVLHTHSVNSTVLGRLTEGDQLVLSGYEMQKAISGQTSHLGELVLPILDNSQDMLALSKAVSERWKQQEMSFGFLVRGHGIYVWGKDVATAKRHLEGWEFLLSCELEKLKIGKSYVS